MPQPMPPAQPAGGSSQRDAFSRYVNENNFIPVWLHPALARGVLAHYGRQGHALVHPHPNSGHPSYAGGGVIGGGRASGGAASIVDPTVAGAQVGRLGRQAHPGRLPPVGARPTSPAMGGIPPSVGAPGQAGRSIFAGGRVGETAPADRTPIGSAPIFARGGTAPIDGTGGGKVPGKDLGRDSVHAILQPGEAIFNKKQLAGIKVKPGKAHLVRGDQKRAMNKASRNARRK